MEEVVLSSRYRRFLYFTFVLFFLADLVIGRYRSPSIPICLSILDTSFVQASRAPGMPK